MPRRLPAAGGRREPGRAAQQHAAPSFRAIESPVHRSPRAAPAAPGPWEPPVPAARPRPPPTSRPEGEGNMAPARGGSEGGEKEKKIKGVQQKGRPRCTRAATTKTKGKQAESRRTKQPEGEGGGGGRRCSGVPAPAAARARVSGEGGPSPAAEPRRNKSAREAGKEPLGGLVSQGVGCRNLAKLLTSQFRCLFPSCSNSHSPAAE